MRFFSQPRLASRTLLSVALLLTWIAGAHLHLCLDGLKPPLTMHHLLDSDGDSDHDSPEQKHCDNDVELEANLGLLQKNGATAQPIPSDVRAWDPAPHTIFLTQVSAFAYVPNARHFHRPPLRAPPA